MTASQTLFLFMCELFILFFAFSFLFFAVHPQFGKDLLWCEESTNRRDGLTSANAAMCRRIAVQMQVRHANLNQRRSLSLARSVSARIDFLSASCKHIICADMGSTVLMPSFFVSKNRLHQPVFSTI